MPQPLHDARAWCDQGIAALLPQIRQMGREISSMLRAELTEQLAAFRHQMHQSLEAAGAGPQLAETVNQFCEGAPETLNRIAQQCRQQIDAQFAPAIAEMIRVARQPLWERYRITQSVATAAPPPPPVAIQAISPATGLTLSAAGAGVQKKVKDYVSRTKGLTFSAGMAGARAATMRTSAGMAGAAIGIAALIGMGAMHARKFKQLKEQATATIDEMIEQLIFESMAEGMIGPAAMEYQLGTQLTAVVYHDATAFQNWIQGVIHHERQLLGAEQQRLQHLQSRRASLSERDNRLNYLLHQATLLCAGLSRDAAGARGERATQSTESYHAR